MVSTQSFPDRPARRNSFTGFNPRQSRLSGSAHRPKGKMRLRNGRLRGELVRSKRAGRWRRQWARGSRTEPDAGVRRGWVQASSSTFQERLKRIVRFNFGTSGISGPWADAEATEASLHKCIMQVLSEGAIRSGNRRCASIMAYRSTCLRASSGRISVGPCR